MSGLQRRSGPDKGSVPFDRGHTQSLNGETRAGFTNTNASVFGTFRARGDRPAREVVTAKLLGDPAPDRVVPVIADDRDDRWLKKPAPIYLTFAAMRAARPHGETE